MSMYNVIRITASVLAMVLSACGARDGGGVGGGAGSTPDASQDSDGATVIACTSASTCPPVECTLSLCEDRVCTYVPLEEGMCCGEWGFQCLGGHCICDGDVKADGTCASKNEKGLLCAEH